MTTTVHAEIPVQLAKQAQQKVARGWAANVESIVAEAYRRYLEPGKSGTFIELPSELI